MRDNYNNTQQHCTLKILQANVDKSWNNHEEALRLADQEAYDIIFIQEPCCGNGKDKIYTPRNQNYKTFSPTSYWPPEKTKWPGVLTYTRIHSRLETTPLNIYNSTDILVVKVNNITTINIYNHAIRQHITHITDSIPPSGEVILAGDFNIRHPHWEPGIIPSVYSKELVKWLDYHDLTLLNKPGTATTRKDSVIDLAFSNIYGAECTIEQHLTCGGYHSSLALSVPQSISQKAALPNRHPKLIDEDAENHFVDLVRSAAQYLPTTLNSRKSIDRMTSAISRCLEMAAKTAGSQPSGKPKRQYAWWNDDCKEARLQLTAYYRIWPSGFNKDIQIARRAFKRAVNKAKRDHKHQLLERIQAGSEIYKITRRREQPKQVTEPPPLKINNSTYSTPTERAHALKAHILDRRDASDDLPEPDYSGSPTQQIPMDTTVSLEAARRAVLVTGNTTPGSDGITRDMLKLAWPHIGQAVTLLYNACLEFGYHPKQLRTAEVVMIPKPTKRDLTDPRSWRPIALLSCLSKGLERLIARRMAYYAITYNIVHQNQAGALPKRSATDLVAALIHDIELERKKGNYVTIATADVQGAYDAILRNRMATRHYLQGWPINLVNWIHSFLSGRRVSIRLQDIVTALMKLTCGLPQGSPMSPVLFILYTAVLYTITGPLQRYGYADDMAMLFSAPTLRQTTRQANAAIEALEALGAEHAITFDPAKTEVMHFTGEKHRDDLPPITHKGQLIYCKPSIRWLGIWFDSQLRFEYHVEMRCALAKRTALHLRSFCTTTHGPSAQAIRQAIIACVLPKLLFGADAWLPGPTSDVAETQPRQKRLTRRIAKKMQVVINIACKAALPVWKTTRSTNMWREASIPPIQHILYGIQQRTAARLRTLDKRHPLVQRGRWCQPHQRHTRLQHTSAIAPWRKHTVLQPPEPKRLQVHIEPGTKEQATKNFEKWLAGYDGITVFTDGSQDDNGNTGCGAVGYLDGTEIFHTYGNLLHAEVYDAEAEGVLRGPTRTPLSPPPK
ncbi:hypothetical protein VHEMI10742 [[Torrubiella] hemipterigena]|uniref:Reverse transcriptase domain-containing protein n=1 Tax=[Torrubiella] hemipterigena TaxID=1531966 RepID=A0A0A1TE15_9HYPO|nr:hypothetical protein VHEMI10742 [[Torrubiella] hemipterigena]